MTVSRSGKRGKVHMRPYGRNGRVRRNATSAHTTRPRLTLGISHSTVSLGRWQDRAEDTRPANDRDNIAPLALQHGRYEIHDTIFRPSIIETEITPRLVNKTVTVIDGWIDADVFSRGEVWAIEYARDLWRDIRFPRHPYFDPPDLEDRNDSFESERAKNLLRRCRRLVGDSRWYIFENVIRWNEPTGIPGSRIATVSEQSIIAAQEIVGAVANEVRWIL